MDGLHFSSYFQVLQSLYQFFGDCTKSSNYNWYHSLFRVPHIFQFSRKVVVLIFFSFSFHFTQWLAGTTKSTIQKCYRYYITNNVNINTVSINFILLMLTLSIFLLLIFFPMSLNLFLWQHLDICSLRLFNCWLLNLYVMMLIFSSGQRLHL